MIKIRRFRLLSTIIKQLEISPSKIKVINKHGLITVLLYMAWTYYSFALQMGLIRLYLERMSMMIRKFT